MFSSIFSCCCCILILVAVLVAVDVNVVVVVVVNVVVDRHHLKPPKGHSPYKIMRDPIF